MSFSLDVIPTEREPISFAEFKQCWLATLADNQRLEMASDIGLYWKTPNDELKDDDLLSVGSHWKFRHTANRALTLSLSRNAESYIGDETEYLDFYAPKGLAASEVAMLAEKWRQAGYHFSLTSYGHYENEKALMCVVAMALAECTKGRVLVTDGEVFYKSGIYTPAQFKENMKHIGNMGITT
jgi:hypothetical protein